MGCPCVVRLPDKKFCYSVPREKVRFLYDIFWLFQIFNFKVDLLYLIGCFFVLFNFVLFWREIYFLSQFILPSALLNSPIIILCNSATAGPKPGMKKEEGKKTDYTGKKNLKKSTFKQGYETFPTKLSYICLCVCACLVLF